MPASLHPYLYAFDNPLRFTDPSGEFPFLLLAAAIGAGALIGAGITYGSQVWQNHQNGLTGPDAWLNCIDWFDVGVGAASGAVAGLIGFTVPYLLPGGGSLLATIGVGALTGSLASVGGQLTTNLLVPGGQLGEGLVAAAVVGGLLGGIVGAGAYLVGSFISSSLRGLSTYGLPPEFQPPGVTGQWQAWSNADIAQFSTMRGSSGIFVLGHFRPPSGLNYIQRAGVWYASYFNPPGYIRKSLTEARLWQVNAEAVRQAVSRGETIRLGTKVNWQSSDSWLFREMDLLSDEFDLLVVGDTFFSNR